MGITFNFSLVSGHYTVGFRLGIRIRGCHGYVETVATGDDSTPLWLSRSGDTVYHNISCSASNWGTPAVVGTLIQS